MVVGHHIAVGRDEEAGAEGLAELARTLLARAAVATAGHLVAELAEEALHRMARGQIGHRELLAVAVIVPIGDVLHLDLHGDDRRLHLVDHIGEGGNVLHRLRHGAQLGMGRAGGNQTALDGAARDEGGNGRCAEPFGGALAGGSGNLVQHVLSLLKNLWKNRSRFVMGARWGVAPYGTLTRR